jgi:dienelactone hydrolase
MVLLHGGGGTAFAEWVRIWNRRGYAAIAIDQCGCVPGPPRDALPATLPTPQSHEFGGPPGWAASFDRVNAPIEDQWPFHAVAAALRAHSLLSAQPGVDPDRIGVTGISWGGYLTGLVAGVDSRLKCAIPVYGCGFLGDNSAWNETDFPKLKTEDVDRWLSLWDPSVYLPHAEMPFCCLTGTNDGAYPLNSFQKSYQLLKNERTFCVRIEMPHGHHAGREAPEIYAFADSILNTGAPLPRITGVGVKNHTLRATFESERPLVKAELCFTRALGMWQDRKFNTAPANIDSALNRIDVAIPPKSTVFFLNITDDRGCLVSTDYRTNPTGEIS